MLERERAEPGPIFDQQFISEKTEGYDELDRSLDATAWDDILTESGLTRKQIVEAAEMFMKAERVITCWAMGLTQHKKAVATIQDVVNLHLAPRPDRQRRCRALSGSRPFKCAGRPDNGNFGTGQRNIFCRSGKGIWIYTAAIWWI